MEPLGEYRLAAMTDERRDNDRRTVRAAVIARRVTPSGPGDEAHGETTDLSMGGFGARLDGQWGTGDVVDADIVLGASVVRIRALVVGVTSDETYQRVHCAFSEPQEPIRSVLEDFLIQHS